MGFALLGCVESEELSCSCGWVDIVLLGRVDVAWRGVACKDGMLGCSCCVDEWTVLGSVASFLGRPWRRGAVLMSVSVSALCGCGTGGALMAWLRMVSKCVESGWRPGSMLMEGARVLMYMASLMPVVFG